MRLLHEQLNVLLKHDIHLDRLLLIISVKCFSNFKDSYTVIIIVKLIIKIEDWALLLSYTKLTPN